MATFVLVHGAWHGAWCWQRVARMLRQSGHEVFVPTLTGLCERSHLLLPTVGLDTHILDVVNEVKWQDLKDVVLVGHSYGGMVTSGAAENIETAIASFVLLDAFLPDDGQSLLDIVSAPVRDGALAAQKNGATALPPRSAASFNVNEQDRAWVDAHCTPQPLKSFVQKLVLTGARDRIAKKTYIRATGYPSPYFDLGLATARKGGWHIHELACGHDVMLDMPERLTEILQEAA